MSTQVTFGYDDSGKFTSHVTGGDTQELLNLLKDFEHDIATRLSSVFDTVAGEPQSDMPAPLSPIDGGQLAHDDPADVPTSDLPT